MQNLFNDGGFSNTGVFKKVVDKHTTENKISIPSF